MEREGKESDVKLHKIIIVCVLLIAAASASAQYLGQMSPASVLDNGTGKMGGYAILAEHATGVVGSLRYGFSEYVEGRARLGFIDPEAGDMGLILGGDFKYLLWKYKEAGNPFDLSLGGFLEYSHLNADLPDHDDSSYDSDVLGVGGSVIGSIPFHLENNHTIEPYARVNLRMQRVSFDRGGSDSELKGGVNFGALFSVTQLVDFTAELQIDDEVAFLIGVDFAAF